MTKEQLSFLFNREINGFYIKKDILIARQKKSGKKNYLIVDMRTDDFVETIYKNIDELFNAKINGETVQQLLNNVVELNIDNVWQ